MGRMIKSLNYYELLEVPNTATQDIIHRAYLKAKETYSNDNPALYTVFTKEEAVELLSIIEEAYSTLSNSESRKQYDINQKQLLAEQSPEDQVPEAANSEVVTPDALKPGYAKTKLSAYKVDNEFENQILENTEFSGPFLRRVREYKCIDLEKLCEHTRISKSYLMALENEEYDQLPAPVFVRGFVTQVAKLYGLNESHTATSYMKRLKGEPQQVD